MQPDRVAVAPMPDPVRTVREGSDGWLFAAEGRGSSTPFDAEAGLRWRELLSERASRFAADGTRYLHVVVPDREVVMADRLPDDRGDGAPGPLAWLAAQGRGTSGVLVDPTDYLIRQRDRFQPFWRTGSEWTPWGCFMTYQMICARLGVTGNAQLLGYRHEERETTLDLGAGLEPARGETVRRYRFARDSRRRDCNELVALRDLVGREDDRHLDVGSRVVFDNASTGAARRCVLLFGDACSDVERHLLTGMLAETFVDVHFVWSDAIDDELVARIRPDIVITQGREADMATVPEDGVNTEALAVAHVAALRAPTPVADDAGMDVSRSLFDAVRARFRAGPEPAAVIRRTTLLESETYRLDPPRTVQAGCTADVVDRFMHTNPVELVDVEDATVYFDGVSWSIRAADGTEAVAHDVDDAQAARFGRRRPRRLRGTTLLFGTSAGAHNYYHWMLELLPKIGLLERHGIALDQIDHFLVREIAGQWQLDTLARFGIDRSRIVETRDRPQLRCDRALHIELACGINLKMHRFIPAWMKHLYPLDDGSGERLRLYIGRPEGFRRGVSNESELRPLLAAADIETVLIEGRSIREQAMLLSRADVVIAPHGGVLTNTVFCRPGTEVVELMSRHVYPYFYGLAASCGHVYHAVLEAPEKDYPRLVSHRVAQSFAASSIQHASAGLSFEVPPEAFARTLDALRQTSRANAESKV